MLFGSRRIFPEEISSTQDYLEALNEKENLPEGTIVRTGFQTGGRGLMGSSWFSDPGKNLLFSILLYPDFLRAGETFWLNKISSLALYDTIGEIHPSLPLKIKWPNDLLLNGKKVCGILIRNQILGERLRSSIWGIGLNVNQDEFSPELKTRATSLFLESGKKTEPGLLLNRFCVYGEKYYGLLKSGDRESVHTKYISALFGFGERRSFAEDNRIYEATIRGVDEAGRLALETPDGLRHFDMKQIQLLL